MKLRATLSAPIAHIFLQPLNGATTVELLHDMLKVFPAGGIDPRIDVHVKLSVMPSTQHSHCARLSVLLQCTSNDSMIRDANFFVTGTILTNRLIHRVSKLGDATRRGAHASDA